MALRTIVLQGDRCLTKACRPVTAFNGRLHQLLDDMAETLADANGAGLAAPQVAHGLVIAHQRRHLAAQAAVNPGKALAHILMHGGFGQAKDPGRLPDGGALFKHKNGNAETSPADGLIHANNHPFCPLLHHMKG